MYLTLLFLAAAVAAEGRIAPMPANAPSPQAAKAALLWPNDPPLDPRLTATRTWHHGSGFVPPTDRDAWQQRRQHLRRQILVAAGLWPLPPRGDLEPVIHGRIEREGYTIEKVFFASRPGHYVSGNLYRPTGKSGPFPGVLSPYGHWPEGRFYRAKGEEIQAQLKAGVERDADAARYPLQARCAQLARMACIVFHYDMVGYADANPQRLPHHGTFRDAESALHGLSIFGLQTWNSIRALDFLLSQPDVDATRIGCTGASGGGTQTFILSAIDDRLHAAAPVCMISADDHQGGCVCENAGLLRLFTDNVEIAALFAPRPLVHPTASGDWTRHFMEQGLPQLRAVYRLFDAEDRVHAERFQADHNYNLLSREVVYNFFNRHLQLGHSGAVRESKFQPVEPRELSVFDAAHPRPADALAAAELKRQLIEEAQRQMESIRPRDAAGMQRYRQVVGSALGHMIASDLPQRVEAEERGELAIGQYTARRLLLKRSNSAEQIPALLIKPPQWSGSVSVVVHPAGKAALLTPDGSPEQWLAALLDRGEAVLAVDVFLTGELKPAATPAAPADNEYFTCYNRTTLANRVHDVLTTIGYARLLPDTKRVNLVGLEAAGPWCLLARALAGDAVTRLAADADRFDFDQVKLEADENFLPSALRYGGLWGLAAVGAPGEVLVYNTGNDALPWCSDAYRAMGQLARLRVEPVIQPAQLADWLSRP
jgi:dienelactone hydrolase